MKQRKREVRWNNARWRNKRMKVWRKIGVGIIAMKNRIVKDEKINSSM